MSEKDQDGRYHHDPNEGETAYPVQEGEQRGPHRRGELDPHESLNTPVSEVHDLAPGQGPHIEGMGGKPPARGERVSSSEIPDEDE
jgi:hypothetical protein